MNFIHQVPTSSQLYILQSKFDYYWDARMSNESLEVQLARLDERNKMILMSMENNQRETRESREQMKEAFESLRAIDSRLERLEGSFATSQPTLDEFRKVKHKLMGAGFLGRWVWVVLTGTLGLLYTMREHLIAFVTK